MAVRGYYSGRLRRRYTAEIVSTRLWERRFALGDAGFPPPPVLAPVLVSYVETPDWSTTATSKVTPTISWQTGDIVFVLGATEADTTTIAPTATGLTFAADTPAAVASTCWANTWSVRATSPGSSAVTLTRSGSTGQYGAGVWVWRNTDGITSRVTDSTTSKTLPVTRVGTSSRVVEGLFDFSAAVTTSYAFTPAAQRTEREVTQATGYTIYVCDWDDQGAAGTTVYGITGTASTGAHTKIAVEVLGSQFQPLISNIVVRRRPAPLNRRLRPGNDQAVFAAAAPPVNPAYVDRAGQRRRLAGLVAARGQVASPPFVVAAPTVPVFPPVVFGARARLVLARRRANDAPAPLPDADRPAQVSRRRPALVVVRRRAGAQLVPAADLPPVPRRRRPTLVPARRGRVVFVPDTQTAVAAPVFPPLVVRASLRRWAALIRRGGPTDVPLVGLAPVVPVVPLVAARQAGRRWAATVRHRSALVPLPQAVAATPPTLPVDPHRHVVRLLSRRPRRTDVVLPAADVPVDGRRRGQRLLLRTPRRPAGPVPVGPVQPVVSRVRRPAVLLRLRRHTDVPRPQVVVANPSLVAVLRPTRRRWGYGWRPARVVGRGARVPLVGLAPHVCVIDRPDSGTVGRPSTGLVTRPASGTVLAGGGIVVRPFTGIVENEC